MWIVMVAGALSAEPAPLNLGPPDVLPEDSQPALTMRPPDCVTSQNRHAKRLRVWSYAVLATTVSLGTYGTVANAIADGGLMADNLAIGATVGSLGLFGFIPMQLRANAYAEGRLGRLCR